MKTITQKESIKISDEFTLILASESYLNSFFELMNDKDNLLFMDDFLHETKLDSEKYISKYKSLLKQQLGALYLLINLENNEVLGMIKINGVNQNHDFYSLGFLIKKTCRKKGLAKKMLNTFINYVFIPSLYKRVECQVHQDNFKSVNLLQGLGFRIEGRLRKNFKVGEYYFDSVVLGYVK